MAQVDDALSRLVARIYDTAFDRYPDADGAAYWASVLASGASLRDIADGFFTSDEFAARHAGQDDTAFVRLLYRDALEREPEPAGLPHWVDRLASLPAARPGPKSSSAFSIPKSRSAASAVPSLWA